jgi:hypothetical protein
MSGETADLFTVEDRIALEERDLFRNPFTGGVV